MWYKNIIGGFFGLVTKHACDIRTDGRIDGQTDSITTPKTALAVLGVVILSVRKIQKKACNQEEDHSSSSIMARFDRPSHRFNGSSNNVSIVYRFGDITICTVYLTFCVLGKSFNVDTTVDIICYTRFSFDCEHIVNTCYIFREMGSRNSLKHHLLRK